MGCSCSVDDDIIRRLDALEAALATGDIIVAKEEAFKILSTRPEASLNVGTILINDGGRIRRGPPPLTFPAQDDVTMGAGSGGGGGSRGGGRRQVQNPLHGRDFGGNGVVPGDGVPQRPQPLSAWSDVSPKSSSISAAEVGSSIRREDTLEPIPQSEFHDALETLKLRIVVGDVFFRYDSIVLAEEQYAIAQEGAQTLKEGSGNEHQLLLANEVWVAAQLGSCRVAIADARIVERHSHTTHDRLCGICLSQCAKMKPVVTQMVGPSSEAMAQILRLEAEAHAERRNYRSALFCAQRASGITVGQFGVGSEERQHVMKMVAMYKEKIANASLTPESDEEREAASY